MNLKGSVIFLYLLFWFVELWADNLVENLSGDLEHTLQSPYFIYRNANQEDLCIQFHNSSEFDDVTSLFQR